MEHTGQSRGGTKRGSGSAKVKLQLDPMGRSGAGITPTLVSSGGKGTSSISSIRARRTVKVILEGKGV